MNSVITFFRMSRIEPRIYDFSATTMKYNSNTAFPRTKQSSVVIMPIYNTFYNNRNDAARVNKKCLINQTAILPIGMRLARLHANLSSLATQAMKK